MQQLSGIDASFLYNEQVHAPQQICLISLYDPATAPGAQLSFEAIMENVASRLHLARAFRQKIVRVPLDVDLPYWIEDAEFDLSFHVHGTRLPEPGTWPQFWAQAATICATPLDRNRPLWELQVIDGLDSLDGVPPRTFAIILKVHHAAVDGVAGMEMFTALHDATPESESRQGADSWHAEATPSTLTMFRHAGANLGRNARPLAGRLIKAVPKMHRAARGGGLNRLTAASRDVPDTRFNGHVSPQRVLEARNYPLSKINQIKSAIPGATLNDVALALVGGALRAYLLAEGTLPELPLIAGVPISIRTTDQAGAAGNEISGMMIPLGTNIADPRERVLAIHEATRHAKEITDAIGARTLTEISAATPGALFGLAARATSLRESKGKTRRIQNTIVSNVPGPQQALYNCGARMISLYAAGPLSDGMGLFHLVASYNGRFTVTAFASSEMLPHSLRYGSCIDASYAALASVLQ